MSTTVHSRCALLFVAAVSSTMAQGPNQIVAVGSGQLYNQFALNGVAPGDIVTLFSTALGVPDAVATQVPLPNSLSGVSVQARVIGATYPGGYPTSLPILRIYTANSFEMPSGIRCPTNPNNIFCSNTQITVEIPTERVCAPNAFQNPPEHCTAEVNNDLPPLLVLNVTANGVTGPDLSLDVVDASPRILTSCDSIFGPAQNSCPALVTHADGTLVSNSSPAKVGETITVYAVGLGQIGPRSGDAYPEPIQMGPVGVFGLTFGYQIPQPGYAAPPGVIIQATAYVTAPSVWVGLTGTYVGLYQDNVTVPPAPGQVYQACGSNGNASIGFSYINTQYICVQP
jgi:uncharacterized protein (TIGR03437 family)